MFFEEFKGSAHLEALEMLSSQASVKLEMLAIEKPVSRYSSAVKEDLRRLEQLFNTDRLNGDEDDESTENEDELSENVAADLCKLVNRNDKMFDVSKYETLANEYASKSTLKILTEKVLAAFKTTSLATREDLSPSELVSSLALFILTLTCSIN